ncbi:MAG TPA: cytochrome P450 [Actinocrinis sp.]|nr:cytochrome P450 [Actinocrinis sp.]
MTVKDSDIAGALAQIFAEEAAAVARRLHSYPDGVYGTELAGGARIWVVSRYEDVRRLLSDPRLDLDKRSSRAGYQGFGLPPALEANLLNLDGEDHARLRRLVSAAFTARRADGLGAGIRATAEALVDGFAGRGETDLLPGYAAPLPVSVICALLGIAADRGAALRAATGTLLAPGRYTAPELAVAMGEIIRLLTEVIEDKRARPADDLLSAMVAARDGEDRLTEQELLSLTFLTLFAGYENSVHLLTGAVARLLADPELAAAVRAEPSPHTPAVGRVVEELLRLDQPLATAIRRFPTEDVRVGSAVIPAGDIVLLAIGAANHDPAALGGHLSFGQGVHYCLGAPLARLETRIAVWTLLGRLPDLALAVPPADLVWRSGHRQRVLTSLPVRFTPC